MITRFFILSLILVSICLSGCGAISGETKDGKQWIVSTPFTKATLGDKSVDSKIPDLIVK